MRLVAHEMPGAQNLAAHDPLAASHLSRMHLAAEEVYVLCYGCSYDVSTRSVFGILGGHINGRAVSSCRIFFVTCADSDIAPKKPPALGKRMCSLIM